MTQLLIGPQQITNYWEALSPQLQRTAERFDLDIVETEELMRWASMVMESPSRSISELRRMLMSGLQALSSTTNNRPLRDGFLVAIMQAEPNVRYATIIRRPGKPAKVKCYLGR